MTGVRLDKWLWAARFFKTRGLAGDEIGKGRVSVNGQPAKASREVKIGDQIEFRQNQLSCTVRVNATSNIRGPATTAQALYDELPESIARREKLIAERRLRLEPAASIEQGRPTKRDRRQLAAWDRWSVSVKPE